MTTTDKPGPLSPNVKRWRAFALLAVAFFMVVIDLTIVGSDTLTIVRSITTMKNDTANSANARHRLRFGLSRPGLSVVLITASFVVITSIGVGMSRN